MKHFARRLALVATGTVALAACGDNTASTSGKFAVQLTDAPFPYGQVSRVDIFVVRIDAKQAAPTDAEASDETAMSGWTTVATPNTSINLLDLTGGKTTNLGATTLTTGVYQGFRMVIDASQSSITLKDGTKPTIVWPSAARTGIKINLDESISVTKDSSLMILDFDLGRSFVMRGNSISQNGLLFKPVIRAVAQELTGSASGSVHADTPTGLAMAGVTVEVLKAGSAIDDALSTDIVRSTQTDASGNYKFSFLLPGTYVVRATPLASTLYLPALLTGGLTITSGVDASGKLIVVPHQ
jgi:hypothetical protein